MYNKHLAHKSPLYGVGINDADYAVVTKFQDGSQQMDKFYQTWKGMLCRCYCKPHKEKRTSYVGCSVCEDWLLFSNFKSWMETQDWEGKQLDKDLLVYQNKVYNPETCVFVSHIVNSFMVHPVKAKGIYPLGVCYKQKDKTAVNERSKPFVVNCGRKRLKGAFKTPMEAHRVWQLAKISKGNDIIKDQTNPKIIAGLTRAVNKIQYDYDNNLETIDF